MRQQQIVHDEVAVRYADDIDHVWSGWEPSLATCDRALRHGDRDALTLPDTLRRAQYHAHASAEFATGLIPPPSATEAHQLFVVALTSCRDALGVLAVRADLDELDTDLAEIGLHALDTTRDAYHGARSSTSLVRAWVMEDYMEPTWLHTQRPATRAWNLILWTVLAACAALLLVLTLNAVLMTR